VAENADESLLWQRVEDGSMPPEDHTRLSDTDKSLLRSWIDHGAVYSAETLDLFAVTTDTRAGYDWWSLQPVVRPPLPEVIDAAWVRNPIDRFILAKLERKQLKPAVEAAPVALVRRLYFDLIGLPPSPEEVAAFVANPTDEAYRELVDRLLARPEYGERWGRHWLDLARFGESDGFERNQVREHQWHYRDWVIRALNDDMPYDQFARMQIAGDLFDTGPQGAAAVAFLTAGLHNTVVGGSEFMQRTARQDELEEIAGTVGQTFLGMTVNCARCHQHKFDPISQTEYYQFVALLDGVYHGQRQLLDTDAATRVATLEREIATTSEAIRQIESPVRERILASRSENADREDEALPVATYAWDFDSGCDEANGILQSTVVGALRVDSGALVIDDGESYLETSRLPMAIGEKTLEAVVTLSTLDQQGGGVISLQSADGMLFDAIVYGERAAKQWMAGSDNFRRSGQYTGVEEDVADQQPVHVAIVYQSDGTILRYRNGVLYGETYVTEPLRFAEGEAVLRFGVRHLPTGGNRHLRGRVHAAKFYDRALTADEIARSAGSNSEYVSLEELLDAMDADARQTRLRLRDELESLQREYSQAQQAQRFPVDTVAPKPQPGLTYVLTRGNAMNRGEVVAPAPLQALKTATSASSLIVDASDAQRRRLLAEWMASFQNPLFTRVIANRLWHYHFGTGIVDTPNDFGFNGGRPSHPELLDWLAAELVSRHGSLKALHRLIVLSATYRQSSRPDSRAAEVDTSNRLLWRKSPQRLDAESLRDAMLVVSGQLNSQRYGPGFRDVRVEYLDGTTYYTPFDDELTELNRRTVYRFSPRGARSALLDTFDCPDPATTAPRRAATTTPLQALALLNNPFSLRMAKHFGERMEQEGGGTMQGAVRRGYQLAFGRAPEAQELSRSVAFAERHGLAALARVLLNSNEFVTIE
jgi:hypothetical protein